MNRIYAALIALALLLTACGSAEESFRDQLTEMGFSNDTADCLIEELDARGLGVEDITDDAIEDGMPAGAEEAMNACMSSAANDLIDGDDDAARVVDDDDDDDADADDSGDDIQTRELNSLEQGFVQGMTSEGVSEEAARCVLGSLMERDIDLMALATMGEDEFPPEFGGIMADCGEELFDGGLDFGGGDGDADDYGDDPELDALHDGCAAGDATACDDLYWQSPFGSAYEAFGATCGNVGPENSDCATLLGGGGTDGGSAGEPDGYGDDAELDALWDACGGGDGDACDELFFSSPVGSAYEDFGDTCGGLFEAGSVLCSDEL